MAPDARGGILGAGLFAWGWLLCSGWIALAADAPLPGGTNVFEAEPVPAAAPDFQEQREAVQQIIEQSRRDAEAAAQRSAETLTQRLTLFEQALETQHRRELDAVQNSNRMTLLVASVLAGTGLLGMFCLVFFLMRATNRLTEVALAVPLSRALGPGHGPNAWTSGDLALSAGNPAEAAGARFLGAIEQLEKRLHELEHTTQHGPLAESNQPSNGQPKPGTDGPPASDPSQDGNLSSGSAGGLPSPGGAGFVVGEPPQKDRGVSKEFVADSEPAAHVALLLAKGQTLLNLDRAADALACFEEVIARDPRNAEALVKKGTALERLLRADEALECYDRAIAVDGSLTTAYLHKGGVFSRQARYEEALKCYERALQVEQDSLAS